jgi:hypothetical protein
LKGDKDFKESLDTIRSRLEQRQDYTPDSSDQLYFGGADVIIDDELRPHHEHFLANQPVVFDSSGYRARRRVVITKNARPLSALFYQFRDSDFVEIDSLTKYAFYGILAQAALDYIDRHGDPDDPFPLLEGVFDAGASFLREERGSRRG